MEEALHPNRIITIMTLEEFKLKLDTLLASMSDEELIASLKKVGCKFLDEQLKPQTLCQHLNLPPDSFKTFCNENAHKLP